MNRKRAQINIEIKKYCRTPRFLSDIVRSLNLNSKMVRNAIDDGVIEKIGEKSSGRGGPKAHVYQAVKSGGWEEV